MEIAMRCGFSSSAHLATMDGDQPRVRGMLLFKAELCFQGQGSQIRVTGVLEQVDDDNLRNEIFNHPTRKFLQAWIDNGNQF